MADIMWDFKYLLFLKPKMSWVCGFGTAYLHERKMGILKNILQK